MNALMSSRRHLIVMASVLGVVVLVAGWFLLISPERQKIAEVRSQVTAQESTNAGLRSQVQMLQELQAKLPQEQAALAKMQSRVPGKPALPELIRLLNTAAVDSGVVLTGITPSAPAAISGANGVSGIDVTLKASGDYLALEQYQLALEGLSRAFLVNGMTIADGAGGSTSGGTGATASTPTTGATQLTATINGRVMLQTATPAAATATPAKTTG
jgi:type IV pilus assembly protein PilO